MAIIKKSDFVKYTKSQLEEKLVQLKEELLKLNAQRAIGTTLESPGKIKSIKRMIAKINTALNQEPKVKEVKKTKT